jgi:hypothetical protein
MHGGLVQDAENGLHLWQKQLSLDLLQALIHSCPEVDLLGGSSINDIVVKLDYLPDVIVPSCDRLVESGEEFWIFDFLIEITRVHKSPLSFGGFITRLNLRINVENDDWDVLFGAGCSELTPQRVESL